jgi:hypothetical protein
MKPTSEWVGETFSDADPRTTLSFAEKPRITSSSLTSVSFQNETLDADGQRLAVSLNTLDFEATGEGTNLRLTIQIVSFCGAGMIEGYESGNKSALENLSRHLGGGL